MISGALRSPYTVVVAALMLLVVGLFSMVRLPLDILPTIRIPAVMVVTTYSGMPAEMIEADITNRLERWLSQASGLEKIESRSMIGVSILNCFFEPGFDPNNALAQISTLVMSDLHYLPPGTQPPIVMAFDPTASLPVSLMTIFTPNLSEAKLWDESNYIVRNQLNAVPGAVAPVVFGGKLRQMMLFLDRQSLSGYRLSPLDVVNALKRGNAMIPTGGAKIGGTEYSITSNGMVPSLAEFDKIPIKIVDGAPVFTGNVGHIEDASAIQTNVVQVNGVRETYIPIFRRMGSNTVAVVKGVRQAIAKVLPALPPLSELKLVFDQSEKISEAVSDVIRELIIGVLLASLVIYLFLGSLKPTFVASLAIPLSVIGTMIGLYFTGNSLNLMTLGGLALVTGPLIDMAVVVIENIEQHLEKGKSPEEAALVGTGEVSLPVLVSTLALIIVFFPVTFFEGLGKFLFTPMAFAVCLAVLLSYFTAMTVVPLAASRLFTAKADPRHAHAHGSQPRIVVQFNEAFHRLRTRYLATLGWAMDRPEVTISLVGIGLLLSLCLFPLLGFEFFPVGDHGQFFIRMRAETGSRIEKTTDQVSQVTASIRALLPPDSVEIVMANTGVLPSWAAAYSPNSASHDSLIEVELSHKSRIGAGTAIRVLRPALARAYPSSEFSYSMIDPVASALNFGALNPIDLRVTGPGLEEGQKIARELLGEVKGVRGVVDAFIEQKLDYPAIHVEVNRVRAAYLGLSADDVIKNIITALSSSVLFAPSFWDDPASGNNYFIGAMYPESAIDSQEAIANIPINPSSEAPKRSGQPTLLRNIAELTPAKVPVEISHLNIKRTFDIFANVEGRDVGSVSSDIDRIMGRLKLPRQYEAKWGGSVEAMRASFGSMGIGLVLALVLIFLLMVAQLKSFVDPLIILATIPTGLIGVLWMLFLTNTTLNIQSMMGIIMLIGIAVSNSVILADFANQRLASGLSPATAMREAGLSRLRPILMTAISTVMALAPSSLSGANAPLARAVVGGLIVSTFMTLVFLPALYVLVKGKEAIRV